MTFADLRSLIAEAEGEITIDGDIAVSGTVVSDHTSPNMAGSPMPKAATKPDMTLNDRTAYLQNADASLGIALVTTDAGQNNLSRYDKLKLWCKGLTLTKRSDRAIHAPRHDAGPHHHQIGGNSRRGAPSNAVSSTS